MSDDDDDDEDEGDVGMVELVRRFFKDKMQMRGQMRMARARAHPGLAAMTSSHCHPIPETALEQTCRRTVKMCEITDTCLR